MRDGVSHDAVSHSMFMMLCLIASVLLTLTLGLLLHRDIVLWGYDLFIR